MQRYLGNLGLQCSPSGSETPSPSAVPSVVQAVVRSPGQLLDTATRTSMEARFDADFSQVRVHTDAQAAESAKTLLSHAYTLEQHVVFAPGRYAPGTSEGRRLLGHELAHVKQQDPRARGRSSVSNAEIEADMAGKAAASGRAASVGAAVAPGIQREPLSEKELEEIKRIHSELELTIDPAQRARLQQRLVELAGKKANATMEQAHPALQDEGSRAERSVSPVRSAAPGSLHRDASDPAGANSGGGADDRVEVIADRATGKLRVVRLNKRGQIVAGLAEITPPKGEPLEAASVEAKLHETSRLTDTRGTYKVKLPPRYRATTNPKETVQVKSTTPQDLARKEANRKKVEEYLDAQDAEFGTNFKFFHQADLGNEEKVAELMRSEGYRKFEDAQNKKRYWTEVKRLMQLDRESIKEAYLARGEVLSDKQADDTWVDRELEKPWDEKKDSPKPHMSALEQWEKRHRAQAEKYLYEQQQRAQSVGFAEEQAEITAHRVAPGSKSSAAEQQEARSWAALAGRDLEGDDAVTRQINAQVREHRGDLVEFATKEAAWARMHHGENSPEARRWQQV